MIVIRFTAMWCTSCLIMKKRYLKVFKELNIDNVLDYDYDENLIERELYNIRDILPVLVILDSTGKEIKRITGEHSEKSLLQLLNEVNI